MFEEHSNAAVRHAAVWLQRSSRSSVDVDAVQWLLSLSFRQLLTRYCVVLGALPSELAKTGCNYGMLVYIGNHILEWMQNGWDQKHMLHHNIDKLWKILWFWLGPGYRQKDLRCDPAVWSLVAMLSSCLALRSLHVAASQNKLLSYSELDASQGYVHIQPHNKNVDFCMGRSEWPEVSRLALFTDSSLQSVKQLQQFVWPHAVLGHYIAIYAKFDNKESIIQLACECLLLLWPVRWVSTALRSVPPYMCSRHIRMSRWIGKLMVENLDQLQCARTDYINAGFKYPQFREVLLQITQ